MTLNKRHNCHGSVSITALKFVAVMGISGVWYQNPNIMTQNDVNKIQRMYGCSKFFTFDALNLCQIHVLMFSSPIVSLGLKVLD